MNHHSAISIHALCEEGDILRCSLLPHLTDFYPRPLRGGRPFVLLAGKAVPDISIHALCEEGDIVHVVSQRVEDISIHALCEEGDFPVFAYR